MPLIPPAPAYYETELRFTTGEEIECRGYTWDGCREAKGQPAYAIHIVGGALFCATHSPFSNIYVPCDWCEERPVINQGPADMPRLCTSCETVKIPETVGEMCRQMSGAAEYTD